MAALTRGIFIVAAKRTPFGTKGGKFVEKSATELQEVAAKAALVAGNINPEQVDSAVFGHVRVASSSDGHLMARHVLLRCGIPIDRPAYSVNRLCGSGFQAIVNGTQNIIVGDSKVVLAGGTENMTQSPFFIRNIRFGTTFGSPYQLEDNMLSVDTYCNMSMALTAEKLSEQFSITREQADDFALRSQTLWKNANENGYFKEELVPVTVTVKKKEFVVDVDEHPRPQSTAEGLAKLPPVFKKNGVVTAGNASGICDGAGAVILASEEAVKEQGLKPLARLVGYSVVGVEPSIMGIGPSPAIKRLLKLTGKKLDDIDLIEINEAFAGQTLACIKDLDLDINKVNVNGGAVALGHPLGASGARITAHLIHELRRRKVKLGIGSACIGGGQGIALLLESIH